LNQNVWQTLKLNEKLHEMKVCSPLTHAAVNGAME